ncbi:hypothetical protein EYS14_04900 [Alteromonadaceae bacterium M269]|nr:hypothetical protein EYS14_04900 [Alteromonadaceae bacterium M269]
MARHMFVTFLIVLGIYVSLLIVIDHPFVANAMPAEEFVSNTDENDLASTETKNNGVELAQEQQNESTTKPTNIDKTEVKTVKKMLFKGPTIVGVSEKVDLNNAEQEVQQVWQKLQSNKVLQHNVAWNKGNIKVYAYYSEFDENFSAATLSIGYDQEDLLLNSNIDTVTLPTGVFHRFSVNTQTGIPSDKAWAQAYIYKNLIERHTLNRLGELVSAEALVLEL